MSSDQIPIGKFSLITRLSQKALRCYDRKGLLSPSNKDICTGYRYYSASQLGKGVLIKALTGLGFPLDDISSLLAAKDEGNLGVVKDLFRKRREEIKSEINRLQKIEEVLGQQGALLEVIFMSLKEPVIKEIAPLRVISIREKGTYGETIPKNVRHLFGFLFSPGAHQAGLRISGPIFALYHDGEYRETDADIEVAVPVTGQVIVSDPAIQVRNLPGGKFLTVVHHGAYPGIHESYARLYTYADEQNIRLSTPGRELYLNNPDEVAEDELLTEIQVPVSE